MIEKIWGKDRILEVYLNVAETGKGIFGIGAAANQYYNKAAKNLSAYEAASIAACLPNPIKYSVKPMDNFVKMRTKKILQQMNVKYSTQYSFNELKGKNFLRFDFCILDKDEIKCLIEYQGEQHYTPIEYFGGQEVFHRQQEYDNLKRKYCQEHNIKLVEIPYWDYNKISAEYLQEKIFE